MTTKEEDYDKHIIWNIFLVMLMASGFLLIITIFSFDLLNKTEYVITYLISLTAFMVAFSTLYIVFFMRYVKERKKLNIKIKDKQKEEK